MSDFTFYVSDITGGAVENYTASLTPVIEFENTDYSTLASVVDLSAAGYYQVSVELGTGEGYCALTSVDEANTVNPTFYNIQINETRTNDEIYSLLLVNSIQSTVIENGSTFGSLFFTTKEGDDFYELLQVPSRYSSLNSWTGLTVKVYLEERAIDSTETALGVGTVTVASEANNTIYVTIPKTVLPTDTVPDGVSQKLCYADVQGTDPDGFLRTILTLNITLVRDYNA